MKPAYWPCSANSDELLLSGHILAALENGRLRMNASDYLSIAQRAMELLDDFDTGVLLRMRRDGPIALRAMAENLLCDRGTFDCASSDPIREFAGNACGELLAKLVRPTA